jgi:hypothetical protein
MHTIGSVVCTWVFNMLTYLQELLCHTILRRDRQYIDESSVHVPRL